MNVLKVVDKNTHRSEELGHWLANDRSNIAVLTEYYFLESFTGNALKNYPSSLDIVRRWPQQVAVMWDNNHLIESTRSDHLTIEDVINLRETTEFREFLAEYNSNGLHASMTDRLCRNQETARRHLASIARGVAATTQQVDEVAVRFAKSCTGYCADGTPILKPQARDELKGMALNLAVAFAEGRPRLRHRSEAFFNAFHFRYALACVSSMAERAISGAVGTIKKQKQINDVIDANYLACGSYFSPLMTNDGHLQRSARIMTSLLDV